MLRMSFCASRVIRFAVILRFARHYASLSFALRASFAALSLSFAVILRFACHFALRWHLCFDFAALALVVVC
jgi:hypothetical protein